MKEVVLCRWRVWWINKWITTSYDSSEEDIRVEHPEAEPVPGTERIQLVPETEEEIAKRLYSEVSTGRFGRTNNGR
jgi:hypothetical protein